MNTTDGGRNEVLESAVLDLVRRNPSITQRQVSERLGLSRRQVERCFSKLKDSGAITRVGSAKTGYWAVSEKG